MLIGDKYQHYSYNLSPKRPISFQYEININPELQIKDMYGIVKRQDNILIGWNLSKKKPSVNRQMAINLQLLTDFITQKIV